MKKGASSVMGAGTQNANVACDGLGYGVPRAVHSVQEEAQTGRVACVDIVRRDTSWLLRIVHCIQTGRQGEIVISEIVEKFDEYTALLKKYRVLYENGDFDDAGNVWVELKELQKWFLALNSAKSAEGCNENN